MKKQKENILIIAGLFIMVALGVSLFLPRIEFQDANYKTAISFVNSNPVGKTIDECIDGLGEPIYIDETVVIFEGGCTRRFGCVRESKEYDLVVLFDEERSVTEVYHPCSLHLLRGSSSLLDLIF